MTIVYMGMVMSGIPVVWLTGYSAYLAMEAACGDGGTIPDDSVGIAEASAAVIKYAESTGMTATESGVSITCPVAVPTMRVETASKIAGVRKCCFMVRGLN